VVTGHRASLRPGRLSSHARRRIAVVVCLGPWLLGFVLFSLVPAVGTLWTSLHQASPLALGEWVGLDNYRRLAEDDETQRVLVNTAFLSLVAVPAALVASMLLAFAVSRPRRGLSVYRAALFLPVLIPPVAAGLIWSWMLDPRRGPVNQGLGLIGIDGPTWLAEPMWTKPALVLLGLWSAGDGMILVLAALGAVPAVLLYAAQVDGARPWARFRLVTLPHLVPTLAFMVLLGVLGALQTFATAFVLAGGGRGSSNLGGPLDSLLFFPVKIYADGFVSNQFGYASATAAFLLAIGLVLAAIILAAARRLGVEGWGR
jgi:multiple sugar transport system permease protein